MPTTVREFDFEWLHDYFETHTKTLGNPPDSRNCILMTLVPRSTDGYYIMGYKGERQKYRAHRLSFILWHRLAYLEDDIKILHRCDNPACVNPFHLYAGTQKDNAADRENRQRHSHRQNRGEKNYLAKLTEEQVREIRRRYKPNARRGSLNNQYSLAKEFGVAQTTISWIITGGSWTHLDAN